MSSQQMFTGLVEGKGIIASAAAEGPARRVVVAPPALLDDGTCRLGDSVAVNGCCLTVVAIDGRGWAFQAGEETLSKTTLGGLAAGDPVNLERPLRSDSRLGGHFVQGHVDGVARVAEVDRDGEWVSMRFRLAAPLARMLAPKGSVAVDGVSLTVVDVDADSFRVALIPHTLDATTLGVRRPGDSVNVEVDILGKYVRRFLESSGIVPP